VHLHATRSRICQRRRLYALTGARFIRIIIVQILRPDLRLRSAASLHQEAGSVRPQGGPWQHARGLRCVVLVMFYQRTARSPGKTQPSQHKTAECRIRAIRCLVGSFINGTAGAPFRIWPGPVAASIVSPFLVPGPPGAARTAALRAQPCPWQDPEVVGQRRKRPAGYLLWGHGCASRSARCLYRHCAAFSVVTYSSNVRPGAVQRMRQSSQSAGTRIYYDIEAPCAT